MKCIVDLRHVVLYAVEGRLVDSFPDVVEIIKVAFFLFHNLKNVYPEEWVLALVEIKKILKHLYAIKIRCLSSNQLLSLVLPLLHLNYYFRYCHSR